MKIFLAFRHLVIADYLSPVKDWKISQKKAVS